MRTLLTWLLGTSVVLSSFTAVAAEKPAREGRKHHHLKKAHHPHHPRHAHARGHAGSK